MSSKINVKSPLVVLHGDEMAQVAFEQILEKFVRAPLNIDLIEIDLTAENRLATNGRAVNEAIDALNTHGVGIKNAGMTVNRAQLDELLAKHQNIQEEQLDKLATKSPNGAIRKGIGGNITREDIPFNNLKVNTPDWIGRDIVVDTMENGGIKEAYSDVSDVTGIIKVLFVGDSGNPVELHRREINKGDPWLISSNDMVDVEAWTHAFFKRAIAEKRDIYLGLKDTVIPGYDGVMRQTIEHIYVRDYKAQVEDLGLEYHYELIDAQAARVVANPPDRAIWGVPDNNTGRKLFKLVEALKAYGIPDRKTHVSISRMSAGGGDQYGSFNMAAKENGILKIVLDGVEQHARRVKQGDPLLFMSNDRQAIKDWVKQVFRDAAENDKEIYFGLKREYMKYDVAFSDVIRESRQELADGGISVLPSFMIMRPSSQLRKMITDPSRNALYPAQNLDGDIFSDISAALGGSLATASSVIESKTGVMLYEAPHGTAHDLYLKWLETKGEVAIFNSSALIYAVANALQTLAKREHNEGLEHYALSMKRALIDTVEQGTITGDLKGKTLSPEKENVVDMHGFLAAVEKNLHKN